MYCSNCGSQLRAGDNFCTGCGARIGVAPAPAVQTRRVVINGVAISDQELAAYGIPIPDGAYWYDPMCGAWGYQGGQCLGFTAPGLRLGGPLRPDASNGNTGVFVNGRQLHTYDVMALQRLGPVLPGRYWVDAHGNCGFEGGPAFANLRAAAMQAAGAGAGGAGGGPWSYTSSFGGTAAGDGQGNFFYSDANNSWSNW
jgi:hypothetical protein